MAATEDFILVKSLDFDVVSRYNYSAVECRQRTWIEAVGEAEKGKGKDK